MFIFPMIVSADFGMPSFYQYQARVTNVSGAIVSPVSDTTVSDTTIPYDTLIIISFEYNIDGVLYGEVIYNNISYYIKLSDIEMISSEIDTTKFYQKNINMYVYEKGAYLYNGPGKSYGKVSGNIEIPVGTTVLIDYSDDMWGHVTYNGVSGWVYIYTFDGLSPYNEASSLANIEEGDETYYTFKEIVLVDSPISKKPINVTIPAFSVVDYKYYYSTITSTLSTNVYRYVTYNGQSGWYIEDDYGIGSKSNPDNKYLTMKSINIYSDPTGSLTSEIVGTIPKFVEITPQYTVSKFKNKVFHYVTYNGISGWVWNFSDQEMLWFYPKMIKTLEDIPVYDSVDGNLVGTTISSGQILNTDYDGSIYNSETNQSVTWYRVKYNDSLVWIKDDKNIQFIEGNVVEENKNVISKEEELYNNVLNEDGIIVEVETKPEVEKQEIIPISDVAIICVAGAVILSLTAVVTIILINKNKKIKLNTVERNTEEQDNIIAEAVEKTVNNKEDDQ